MTRRGLALLSTGLVLLVVGRATGWPELTAMGAAAVALVVLVLVVMGPRPDADVVVSRDSMRVVRGTPATASLTVALPGRRALVRLVEGDPARPVALIGLPARRRERLVEVPLDTSRRGEWTVGPFHLVQRDPWGLVCRDLVVAEGGTLLVQPRVHALRSALVRSSAGIDAERSARRLGDEHFHALREYVLGDEARLVHWRSSARAGRLVVKQRVAAAVTGIAIVLDCDRTSYGDDRAFSGQAEIESERFELAVEVAASVAASAPGQAEPVHLLTTLRDSSTVTGTPGASSGLLKALATVQPAAPVDCEPELIADRVRRARCARVILVTGSPGPRVRQVAASLSRMVPTCLVVRIGAEGVPSLGDGLTVLDIANPEDLVA